MIPLLIAGAAAVMGAADYLTDNNGNSVSLRSIMTAPLALDPIRRNTGVLPTPEQIAAFESIRSRPGHAVRAPSPIVPRVRTPPPEGSHPKDLMPWVRRVNAHLNSSKAGYVLAALYCEECGAGVRPNAQVAGYNHNYGNQKLPLNGNGPAYFLVDNLHSLDFYPSKDTLEGGVDMWVRLLSNPNYNRTGEKGARQSMMDGDCVGFGTAIGNGGYAASYSRNHNLILALYRTLVRVGAIDNGLGL